MPRYMSKAKAASLGPLLHAYDFTIVAKCGSKYRGLVQYYLRPLPSGKRPTETGTAPAAYFTLCEPVGEIPGSSQMRV